MKPRIVTIKTHLSKDNPPDSERLRIALEKFTKAIYGPKSTLTFVIGHTEENPIENMLEIFAPLNKAIMQALEESLENLFGIKIVLGYKGDTINNGAATYFDIEWEILQAKNEVHKVFQKLNTENP